jgi:hypothetical protein
MNNLKLSLYAVLLAAVFMASCKDDTYELGALLDKSQINYEVLQPAAIDAGGNTVVLKNNTPGTISMWDYGTGRSNRQIDTIRIAFKGTYTIKFSAITAGGIVECDSKTITVTKDNFSYVNDPMWTNLTGGVGHKKKWFLDVDAKSVTRLFSGPLFFHGRSMKYGGGCVDAVDCWNWDADYAGNSWVMPAADYGSMTFSLINGPFIDTNQKTVGRTESGTYYLDVNKKTISITDAGILHDLGRDACVAAWGDVKILSLTENGMQLGVLRTSCEGPCLLVYNYISEDYYNNWTPKIPPHKDDEGFNPTFAPGEILNLLTGGASSGRYWTVDATGNPIDWIGNGNGWTTAAENTKDWGWVATWDTSVKDSWVRFDTWGGQNYTRFQNGVETKGTFTIDEEKKQITLVGNTLLLNPESWMNPTETVLTIVKSFGSEYKTKGIWLGTRYDPTKKEWFAFHYVLSYKK